MEGAEPFMIWRIWIAGKGGLKDIQNNWTIDEVLTANQLLDAQEEYEYEAHKHAAAKSKKKR